MPRLLLSDEHGSKLREILLQNSIYDKCNLRMTVEAMLYRMRMGCPWRDLPDVFGCWNTIYKRFNAGSAAGKWVKIFKAMVVEPDLEWVFIDGSYVKAHQHSAGAASDSDPTKPLGKVEQEIPVKPTSWWMLVAFLLSLKLRVGKSMIVRWILS